MSARRTSSALRHLQKTSFLKSLGEHFVKFNPIMKIRDTYKPSHIKYFTNHITRKNIHESMYTQSGPLEILCGFNLNYDQSKYVSFVLWGSLGSCCDGSNKFDRKQKKKQFLFHLDSSLCLWTLRFSKLTQQHYWKCNFPMNHNMSVCWSVCPKKNCLGFLCLNFRQMLYSFTSF